MQLTVDGKSVFATTGGKPFDPTKPVLICIHGAGGDRTGWMSLARYAAHHGWSVLAPDLPGHGRSAGPALTSIAAMSTWLEGMMVAARVETAALAGHSMGGAIAIETAARLGTRISHVLAIGTAAAIPVGAALLEAARSDPAKAYDMMTQWAHAPAARSTASPSPGLALTNITRAVFSSNPVDVLAVDLSACAAWTTGPDAAKRIPASTHVIAADLDVMTPTKRGRELAALIPGARYTSLPGVGHMIMQEAPHQLIAIAAAALAAPRANAA
jgi:pimeloyl-ACP methyl ester carboxylesterase